MGKKEVIISLFIFFTITALFFNKTIFQGLIPFPGDLLIAEYNPWKTYSYLGYVPGSFPNKAQYFDVLRQLYPWKTLVIEAFKQKEIPLWNPYNFSGTPLLANFQSAPFYPLNIFYLFLPQFLSWTMLVILQPFLASFFTYLFARKIGISKIGSLFPAASFAFSSFMTVWLEYNTIAQAILWLPLILLSLENILENKRIFWMMVFVFSLSSSLLAGHPQIFTYLFIFVNFYFILKLKSAQKFNKKIIPLFIILYLLSFGISAVQIIPGIELIKESARSPHSYDFLINKILIQPWQFIMLLVPDFFGNPATRNYWLSDTYIGKVTSVGLVSFLFAIMALGKIKSFYVRFFLIYAGVIFLFSTLNPLTIFLYRFKIPFVSDSAPTLSIFIAAFSLSILAGFGVDVFKKENFIFKNYFSWVSPLILIFIFLWLTVIFLPKFSYFDWISNLSVSFRNLLYSTFILIAALVLFFLGIYKKNIKYVIIILLFILQIGDGFRYFEKFNPFVSRELIFPKNAIFDYLKQIADINRIWGYGTAYLDANFASQFSLFSPDGYDPLYPRRYGEFIQSSANGKINNNFTTQTRSDAVIASGYGETDLTSNNYRLKVMDALGVKYVLDRFENKSTEKTFPKERFKLIFEDSGWKIYENLKAAPRAFLTSDYQVFKTNTEFEKKFFSKNFNPSKTIFIEENINFLKKDNSLIKKEEKLSLVNYSSQKVTFNVKTNGNNFLFLSDTYYPGWKAYVNDVPSKIFRANYAFRAVYLEKPGEYKVSFIFDPKSYKIGELVSIISLISFLIFILFVSKKKFILR